MRRVYLDHTATTPIDPRVLEAMQPYFSGTFGNASSVHWFGRQAREALECSREVIASAIGAGGAELYFTSGGTESDNFALTGTVRAARPQGRTKILTSQAEHHAILECCQHLGHEGFAVTLLPVFASGVVDLHALREALSNDVALVSIMHANNEVGTISPIAEIADAAHRVGAVMHTDAVQTLGKIPVDVNGLGVDAMSVSAHKLYGPKGIGALYVRRGTEIEPLILGGAQEKGMRAGTENVALAVGFAKAVEIAVSGMKEESERLQALRDALELLLRSRFPALIINGDPDRRLPQILNVSFDSSRINLQGEMLVVNMDLRGIAVTSGSACTSGSMQPSHVLLAMGRDQATATATLRFSFGRGNSEEDVQYAGECLTQVIAQMTGHR